MPDKILFVVVEPKSSSRRRSEVDDEEQEAGERTKIMFNVLLLFMFLVIKPQNVSELERHYFRGRVCLFLNNPLYLHLFSFS